jgi:hypothetical protein
VPMREDLDIPMPAMAPSYRVTASRRNEMDPATKRLAIFAGVIGGALILLVGAWSFTGHRSGGVPVITADSRPLRVKPADPGGLQVEGADQAILSGDSDGKSALAAGPETPAPQALKAEEQAAAKPAPLAAQPATTPTATAAAAPPPPAETRPVVQAATSAPATTKPAAAPAAKAAAAGGVLVQLAAVRSEEAARSEWTRLSHKYGDLLAGKHPMITQFERDGTLYWRLRTSGFSAKTDAVLFCERIKAKGGGCAVTSS